MFSFLSVNDQGFQHLLSSKFQISGDASAPGRSGRPPCIRWQPKETSTRYSFVRHRRNCTLLNLIRIDPNRSQKEPRVLFNLAVSKRRLMPSSAL